MPGPTPRLHLPWAQWPEQDRRLWTRAFVEDDPFAEDTAAHLSKASKENCLWAYRRFLGYLNNFDPRALDLPPHERLTPPRVRSFAAHIADTSQLSSQAATIDALYRCARFMMPKLNWAWLKALKTRLMRAAPKTSAKGPVITSLQLLALGERLMQEAKTELEDSFHCHKAAKYRDGLILAFAAFYALRPKNLVTLELGRHLRREGDRWFILIPPEETKTRVDIDFELDDLLLSYLPFYLECARPKLMRGHRSPAFWISARGGRLSYVGLVKIFARASTLIGVHVAPHDVRDAAETLWAIAAPDNIGISSELLTHKDPRASRYYNRAKGIEASRVYRQLIASRRGKRGAADS